MPTALSAVSVPHHVNNRAGGITTGGPVAWPFLGELTHFSFSIVKNQEIDEDEDEDQSGSHSPTVRNDNPLTARDA